MHFHKRRPFYLSLTPLAMIIPLTVGGVSASWVSTASATDASALTHRFSIEKGPLTGQLVRFAQQAGIELAGNAAYTDGKVGPGLDGNYSVTEVTDRIARRQRHLCRAAKQRQLHAGCLRVDGVARDTG
ncbi:Ferrichrome-iron receptor [Pseudomonas amygdali pv. morsprunorum]|nr:Ferrichrome-iron receptor [Pseudomonas amygdali pv. morsprunorum]